MEITQVQRIADAVLYEGYMLYPYRPSSVKNQQRFNWGAVFPKAYCDSHMNVEASEMRTECLVIGNENSTIDIKIRFLHLADRQIGKFAEALSNMSDDFELVPSLDVDGRLYQSWQEAIERDVTISRIDLMTARSVTTFCFPNTCAIEPISEVNGRIVGVIRRYVKPISGEIHVGIDRMASPELKKISVRVTNTTPFELADNADRNKVLLNALVSTHTILSIENGEFLSLIDPPDVYRAAANDCENVGTFPVLAGDTGKSNCVLSSPIILYDHPQIATESAGDLFDGTEIDEILTLRIMTLTEEEKREMRAADDRTKEILDRTERIPEEQLIKMHGALRGLTRNANGQA